MKYEQIADKIVLTEYNSFHIKDILECGQCFRFTEIARNEYELIAFGKALHIKQENNTIEFYPTDLTEFESLWMHYFDLHRDYKPMKNSISKNDEVMSSAIQFADGIRILNQEPFECLISFIISQNSRIPRIKQVIHNLSAAYGTKIRAASGEAYAFPTPSQLAGIEIKDLMKCKTGFRGKYIFDAVTKISTGEINLEDLKTLNTQEAKKILMTINGVGPKVADCVLLFSFGHSEVFPTDVWIKRVMQFYYFNNVETDLKKIQLLAAEKYGEYAGFSQQYLFHYARLNKIGIK